MALLAPERIKNGASGEFLPAENSWSYIDYKVSIRHKVKTQT